MKYKYIKNNASFIFGLDDMAGAMLLGSLIGGGTSLTGGIVNSFGQASANEAMREEAQKNRDWQTQEAEKSRQWQLGMWNSVNEYNSPKAQLQRLREANINPLTEGFASNSQNVSTPAVPSSPSMPNIDNPLAGLGQGISQAAQTASQVNLTNAQTNLVNQQSIGENIKNLVAEASKDVDIQKRIFDALNAEAVKNKNYWDAHFAERSVEDRIMQEFHKAGIASSEDALAAVTLAFAPERLDAELSRIKAESEKLRSEGKLNDQKFEINEMTKFLAQEYGVSPDADALYNIATLLLNPVARENLCSKIGILDFFKGFVK